MQMSSMEPMSTLRFISLLITRIRLPQAHREGDAQRFSAETNDVLLQFDSREVSGSLPPRTGVTERSFHQGEGGTATMDRARGEGSWCPFLIWVSHTTHKEELLRHMQVIKRDTKGALGWLAWS